MAKPSEDLSKVAVAVVSIFSGVKPASPNWADTALEKHPAWAAPMSSSGFVPGPSSKRGLKPYCAALSTPLSLEIVPLPSRTLPVHTADAFFFISLSMTSATHGAGPDRTGQQRTCRSPSPSATQRGGHDFGREAVGGKE